MAWGQKNVGSQFLSLIWTLYSNVSWHRVRHLCFSRSNHGFSSFLLIFHWFGVYIYTNSERAICNVILSGNPCCFFMVFGIKAILRPFVGLQTCFWCFDIGIYNVSGALHLTSKKMRPNSFSQGSSEIVYIYTKAKKKWRYWSKIMILALLY